MKTEEMRLAAAVVLALSLAAQGGAQARADKPGTATSDPATMPKTDRIQMAEFRKLLAANAVVVVDVRGYDAYLGGHIPGALSIPEETITTALAEKLKRMGKPVATYCT